MSAEDAERALKELLYVLDREGDSEGDAGRLLEGMSSVKGVYEMDADDLIAKAGISRRAAEAIDLIDELARRVGTDELGEKPRLDTAQAAGEYFRALMRGRHVEYCYAACLGRDGRLIRVKLLQKGTLDSANIYVREVVQLALRCQAHSVVLAHNHPGGTLRPSGADVSVTKLAVDALKMIDVRLIEHVVVTENGSTGIIEEGYLN